ncbi:MAG: DUF1206 domain-containing protein [Acidimicrobiales bacterium]
MTSTLRHKGTTDMSSGDEDLADKAADSPWVEGLARAGLVARGVLYLTVGVLALQIAFGSKDKNADKQGALSALARQPLGKFLLVAVAVGFAGYALWRFLDAILDTDGEGTDLSGIAKRAADFARGLLYVSFFVTAVRLVTGSSGEDQSKEADVTARVMSAPLGRFLVALVGAAIVGGGLYTGYRAVSKKYRKKLRTGEMSPTVRRMVTAVASVGLAARMVVFLLIGTFLLKAAIDYDANEAVGVDGALKRLADRPYGPLLLAVVAVGLFAYGLYSFVEARYRKVMED